MPECAAILDLRYRSGSEGSNSNPAKFNNQDFAQLKSRASRRRRLFVDNTFPPTRQSLGDLPEMSSRQEAEVEWLRPGDILKAQNVNSEPVFVKKGASRFDFGQGGVGNCWFLASISSLTFNKHLLAQVVPMDQTFSDYDGIFHFRFWRFGKWVDVVIDDFLPTYNNQLLSVRVQTGNEFWAPLLEKAYAKVCGSYNDMNAGLPSEACKDFTGGVAMIYELRNAHTTGQDVKLWRSLNAAYTSRSLVCCGTPPKGTTIVNTVAHTGIVDAHAYSVTGITEVECYGSKVKLVRLMNPWGRQEWNGKWSDKSDMWDRISPEDREKCMDREDGEFWMELEDFCHYYASLFICCENPNFIDGDIGCKWQCMGYEGKWVAGRSAGGSLSNSSFATNPQYRIEVTKIDRTEDNDQNILISLLQKPNSKHRKQTRTNPIGVTVFQVPEGTRKGPLGSSFFRRSRPLKQTQMYTYDTEKVEQHSLQPGEYVIVPNTMKPYMNGDFVLTVYTKTDAKITPHDGGDDHDHEDEDEDVTYPKIPTDNEDKDSDKEEAKEETNGNTRALFNRYANQSGLLDAWQLRKLLNDNFPHGTWKGFGLDTCLSMIAIMDTDRRTTMSYTEFSRLWKKMAEYEKLFDRADVDSTGALNEREVSKAIEAAGMNTNDIMVQLMVFRYSGSTSTSLEAFITLMLRLDKSTKTFNDKSSGGVITFNWDEWATASVYS